MLSNLGEPLARLSLTKESGKYQSSAMSILDGNGNRVPYSTVDAGGGVRVHLRQPTTLYRSF